MVETLERFVYMTNSMAIEFPVTVLVRGRLISGLLTPNERFRDWMHRTYEGAAGKGLTSVPGVHESPMSKDDEEALRKDWRQRIQEALDDPSPDAIDSLRHPERNFCLRNAVIWGSSRGISAMLRVAYLMLDLDAVEGFTVGELTESK